MGKMTILENSLQEWGVGLILIDLVADVVDVGWEVVLGVVVDNVTDIRKDQVLEYALIQVFQEPVESNSKGYPKCKKGFSNHRQHSGNDPLHLCFSFLSRSIFVPSDLVVVQVINPLPISLFLYLHLSFLLPFLTSRWPLEPSGCWRRGFFSLWWSLFPPALGCPGSVRSELAGIEGKRPQMSKPQTYSAREEK